IYHWKYGLKRAVVESTKAFDKHMPCNIPRIALIDYANREITDTLLTVNEIPHLYGIRIDTCGENYMQGNFIPSKEEEDVYSFGKGVSVLGTTILHEVLKTEGAYKIILSSGFGKLEKVKAFLDLEKGDYVVHVSYGIARFLGMQMLSDDDGSGRRGEFLVLEFAEGAKMYVPVTMIELVQKYICGSDHEPKLSKIGKRTWERKKQIVEEAVRDVASALLSMQAIREAKRGIAYPKDTEWQRKFESEFIYLETDDQLQVAEEIKKDMESSRPMDRLVCGDVGFGKTEIAIRAAFKAVMYGKQVAVLVPTTILAQQHYRTFSERMVDYPVNVDVLSRFKTRKEQKEILQNLQEGKTDIVIGTHRLIQKDVIFKDIGLVVIDEEQRFGVEHKEKLKKLRETVDVLTLTATPIPRTLHMSLLGLRDVSSLNIPPQERQSILTRLLRFDLEIVRKAIIFELNRDGQVYFVHNRVKDINRIADIIAKTVPEAEITVAHGQMPERTLEKKMSDFVSGKSDILVSTTIIESGLDIPNVNTIFINHSDAFGLADLHQLRGRVGRYKHRAYAYLLLPKDRPVTPEAEKRLKAIVDFSELGAGFKIAMRDLEIRGAGNIIGIEQHGHIEAVGYEMFCRLLEIAIRKARNEPVPVFGAKSPQSTGRIVCGFPPQRNSKHPDGHNHGNSWPAIWRIIRDLELNYAGGGSSEGFSVASGSCSQLTPGYYETKDIESIPILHNI
ncbi:hypothetical protein LCGC14_1989280, partial [marine sediment metagenome]